jgi:hypothetical protein
MTPSKVAERIGASLAIPGAFGKVEAELAAALIVLTLTSLKSEWAPVRLDYVAAFIEENGRDYPILGNPFVHPDPHELVKRGFAKLTGEIPNRTIELTEDAIGRICSALGVKVDG